jgi:hypothetical protein
MDDIILRVSRHYITGIIGILGLGAATYAIRRYLSNNEKTTSTYYTRPDELNAIPNLALLTNPSARKIYIFWNGSINSTYLLLDYLQQDYIVQPIYIERYTIRKALEHDQLLRYTAEYNNSRTSGTKCDTTILEYLADVAKMKRQQSQEISLLTTLRRVITNQYTEFRANLLPTRYITVIEKDLAHSQRFYDALRVLRLQPLEYAGIELYEQASRYISNEKINSPDITIVMGYSQNSHLTSIIQGITQVIIEQKEKHTDFKFRDKIDLPLAGISNKTIKYLASQKINKEVIRFLNSNQI